MRLRLGGPGFSRDPRPLSEDLSHSAILLDAFLGRMGNWDGPGRHGWLGEWIESGLRGTERLRLWLEERLAGCARPLRRWAFEEAERLADHRVRHGLRAAVPASELQSEDSSPLGAACPRVLFGKGDFGRDWLWLAVFNSRKPKAAVWGERWLSVFLAMLDHSALRSGGERVGYASSRGTLTYDLVTLYAEKQGLPLLEFLPRGFEAGGCPTSPYPSLSRSGAPHLLLGCTAGASSCPKNISLVCRDRLLAFLSDHHLVIEVRAGGNLTDVLTRRQRSSPRSQWVFLPEKSDARTGGNLRLLAEFPEWSKPVREGNLAAPEGPASFSGGRGAAAGPARVSAAGAPREIGESPALNAPASLASAARPPGEIAWKEHLYHYTRSCPGPWPGESHEDYLASILRRDPLSGHGVLDTLARILLEARIRAGGKLIRGRLSVTSWTSRPPAQLESIRRWNRGLLRWTFEPYGLAVRRERLMRTGARPVVYGGDEVYARLKDSERFRFQRHKPVGGDWKAEREWRTDHDFSLEGLGPEDGFIFVPEYADAEGLEHRLFLAGAACELPLVILSGI